MREVLPEFFVSNDALSSLFGSSHFDPRCNMQKTPLDRQAQHSTQNAQFTISRSYFSSLRLSVSGLPINMLTGDCVKVQVCNRLVTKEWRNA
jgi:hypothetical protein